MTPEEFLTARWVDVTAAARAVQAQAVTDGLDPADPRLPQLPLAAYVLADIAAKRAILALHDKCEQAVSLHHATAGVCEKTPDHLTTALHTLELAVKALCLPFADHPDYQLLDRVERQQPDNPVTAPDR